MVSTVGAGSTAATLYDCQRKVGYDQGLYWVFYGDGTNIVYRTSSDGSTWSAAGTVRASASGTYFSIWFDTANHKVDYAFSSGTSVFFRTGSLGTGGGITWDYTERSFSLNFTNGGTTYPSVCLDTSGNLWISASSNQAHGGSTGNYIEVWEVPTPLSTGTPANSINVQTDTSKTFTPLWSALVPLTSGALELLGQHAAGTMQVVNYNGSSWSGGAGTTTYQFGEFAAVAVSDVVYFAAINVSSQLVFWSATSPTSEPAPTTLDSSASFADVGISTDGGSGPTLVIAYSPASTSATIYYKDSTNGGTSWSSAQTLVSSEDIFARALTQSYSEGNSNYQVIWTQSTSPYNVRFDTISLGPPPVSVAVVKVPQRRLGLLKVRATPSRPSIVGFPGRSRSV